MEQHLEFQKSTDAQLKEIMKEHKLGLSLGEARHVPELLGRNPTLTEATIFSIQGSEHCSYKSSRRYLSLFPTEAPNVILGPGEDSGVVAIQDVGRDRYGLIMAHESHNHPSQVVPYEGAATGVGGIVRDVLCMGGRVIGTLDPLRFGEITDHTSRWVANGVISGISGYGNPIGVPNLGGDINFHKSYNDNCLVNVVSVGLLRESELIHSMVPKDAAEKGYEFILVGKATDRSGMGGASFASANLDEDQKESKKSAVQEPNPFLKRHIMASTYDLFKIIKERGWLNRVAFKDFGAGGFVCSSVEMVSRVNLGAEMNLEAVNTAYKNMEPHVIACAETQERMMWCVHPDFTQLILDHYNKKWKLGSVADNAGAFKVGKVVKGEKYVLMYKGEAVVNAKACDLTEGFKYNRAHTPEKKKLSEPKYKVAKDLGEVLLKLLDSENIASRRPAYERYDKQVQGFVHIEAGEADASVICPLIDENIPTDKKLVGVALKTDGSSEYGEISAYWQGYNAVIESMRNVAAVGAYPQAVTDCLNYGNPEHKESMDELVEGITGIADALKSVKLKEFPKWSVPVISGNVSLYNENPKAKIVPSAVICCVGTMPDYRKSITMQLKNRGSVLYLINARKDELGGSEYYRLGCGNEGKNFVGKNVPKPDGKIVMNELIALTDAIQAGFVLSAHDISEGGIAVTLAEMCFGGRAEGNTGIEVNLKNVPDKKLSADKKLFSQTGGFVVEIDKKSVAKFLATFKKASVPVYDIGKTKAGTYTILDGRKKLIDLPVKKLAKTWQEGLWKKLK
ncbi:MAG: phosphoribosylformylglycinamidine synthase II (FGAM synthase II), phosphoribosylformylglycinamidine synthase [Candidatus Peregrinibacteria bacterium GW2011_GWC2_39_14]|nr:MAG: Phosphoribosylformylglycinamidine synthase 2 [Candidatus Peregrinibacteria bacterium GW2011_GWA2_38_36]KKR04670.1 MAG: phosphoribosylformylglycinamidine synthase II (FGAM synthase II), phosphoribosylformylglycinamidine synthase [Candidatus Peregrinibacteria bacterium GW2011_GWC2_39_14]